MSEAPALVWFRQDLRLADNPAFAGAVQAKQPVLALYVLDDRIAGDWAIGGAQRWWLHQNLKALGEDLRRLGVPLVLRRGDAALIVPEVARAAGAAFVYWNRRYTAFGRGQDAEVEAALEAAGVGVETHNALLIREPWEVAQKSGAFYKVYTAYAKAWLKLDAPRRPVPRVTEAKGWSGTIAGDDFDDWGLEPKPDWTGGMRAAWEAGEAAADARLRGFLDEALSTYAEDRNRPDKDGSSRLSPYLHIGAIGPATVWHATAAHAEKNLGGVDKAMPFLNEIVWREFAYHTLYYQEKLPDRSLREKFEAYPWRDDEDALRAWQLGQTGYPIVDAGMRQLWTMGWMHNRVRMIVGSFLTKDLGIHWREGARWFWDCLIDADLGNNSLGWQWVSGAGIDATPFFRVFNPTSQGRKYDPKGDYVRAWVPELRDLPAKHLHEPAKAPAEVLKKAGVVLGETYPRPIVDHGRARDRALDGYRRIK